MKHLGYCVLKNGVPVGVCPVGWLYAQRMLERYKTRDEHAPSGTYCIVPMYAGAAITSQLASTAAEHA